LEGSLKFEHIENNLVKLYTLLSNNNNIAKYICYLVDDPLSMPDVSIDLKVNGNYILTLLNDKVLTEEKVRIFLNPIIGDLKYKPLGDIIFEIDIVVPNRCWILNGLGKLRAYRIMDEFAKMVDGQVVAGLGEVNITNFKAFSILNTDYSCLSALITTKTSTLKGGF